MPGLLTDLRQALELLLGQVLVRGASELRLVSGTKPSLMMPDDAREYIGERELNSDEIVQIITPLLDTSNLEALWNQGQTAVKCRVEDHRFKIVARQADGMVVVQARPLAIRTSHMTIEERDAKVAAAREAAKEVVIAPQQVQLMTAGGEGRPRLEWLMLGMEAVKASDLHLRHGRKPCYRVNGEIQELDALPVMTSDVIKEMFYEILDQSMIDEFEERLDLDHAHSTAEGARFRMNAFVERGSMGVVARRVSTSVPNFVSLGLPPLINQVTEILQGLVLVCGPTGSGKSTTLAATIEAINHTRACNIITLEDPIEYSYVGQKALIAQREIGIDVRNWSEGLRHVLRQDPDVILIGELRDPETFETALQASETGHLCFGTMHSATVAQTVSRILELFPSEQHHNIRQSLAFNLRAVICQKLMPRRNDDGLTPAIELMLNSPSVQKSIRESRDQILQDIISGDDEMQTFNQALHDMIKSGAISPRVAYEQSPKPERLKMMLSGIKLTDDKRILG